MALFNQKDDTQTTSTTELTSTRPQSNMSTPTTSQSVFGATLIIEGTIKSQEHITVNGELKGTVETSGSITIGKDAKIDAALTGKTIAIGGTVTGNITATDALTLESSAIVKGDITAGSIQIQAGARVDGNMQIGKNPITLDSTSNKSEDKTNA